MRGISFRDYKKSWRNTIDPKELNEDFDNIFADLGEAFRREQYINNKHVEFISDLSYQNQQLSLRIQDLEDQLVAASGHYATSGGNLMYWNAYSSTEVSNNTSNQDLTTGDVTLPRARSWTKIPLVLNEYGNYEADTSLRIAYDDSSEVYKEKPDDLYDMVDNNPETTWCRAYTTPGAPSSVTIRLELPSSTNPAINSLYIAPFPECGPTVTSLRYLTGSATWTSIPGFTSCSKKRRYHFSPLDYNNQVDFTMTPTTLLNSDGQQVKVFGMQVLDVSLIEYVDSSSFIVRLDAAPGDTINNITYAYLNYSINPSINEDNIIDTERPVVVEIYEDAALTTRVYSNLLYSHPYAGSISLGTPSNSLWTKVTLRKVNSTTPVVRELTIKYT